MQKEIIEGFRLSPQQERLWLLQQGSTAFRSEYAVIITGALRTDVLIEALHLTVSRHEILRTSYEFLPGMDVPVQVIGESSTQAFPLWETDLSQYGEDEQQAKLEELWLEERRFTFDFEHGPMLRVTLVMLGADRHALLFSLPALCADACSLKNLLDELSRNYAVCMTGDSPDDEPVQYIDYAEWQHSMLEEEEAQAARENRRQQQQQQQHAATIQDLRLPGEGRPGLVRTFDPQSLTVTVDQALTTKLFDLARDNDVTPAVLLLTGWQALLWRLTKQPGVVVECLFDGRTINHLHKAIGLFAKHLPVQGRFEESFGFVGVLDAVRESFNDALAQQEYFVYEEKTADEGADAGGLPIGFEYDVWPDEYSVAGMSFSPLHQYSCTEPFKLKLSVAQIKETLRLELRYDAGFYTMESVKRIAEEFQTLLESMATRPESPVMQLDMLGHDERELVLVEWNQTKTAYQTDACLHQLFEQQAESTPDSPAVSFQDEQLSYAELNARANRLARHLQALSVGAEARVGILMERSIEMIVSVLGILKAGGAYVPLDSGAPAERLRFMLDDAGITALVTQQAFLESLPSNKARVVCLDTQRESIAQQDGRNLEASVTPNNLAYVIYTSGSTGAPKGVMIEHRSVVNLSGALEREIYAGQDRGLRVSVNAPLVFDASVKQVIQLLHGHMLSIVPDEVRRDAEQMFDYLVRERVNVLDCTPSLLRLLEEQATNRRDELTELRAVLVGGEELDAMLWEKIAANEAVSYFNVYGPTECTVDSTVCRVERGQAGIGSPISNVQVYLLDDRMQPVPVGVEGELYIGGDGLARGYLNRPDLTAEKFVPNPFGDVAGSRLYRTGDLGRWSSSGRIEFTGRIDGQVKVRGYRIELGEIEAVLAQHSAVREAAVVMREGDVSDRRLIAYAVANPRYASIIEGRPRYELPNGMAIVQQNKNETDYLYEELFVKQIYIQHGIRLRENACVFDVGANIGLFTLFISQQYPSARIYAFEPIAPIFETLRINANLYGSNVKLFPVGLSQEEKTETFTYYPRYSMMSGLSAYANATDEVEVIKRYISNEEQSGAAEMGALLEHADEILAGRFAVELCESQLRKLSDVLREEAIEHIDLLKIDVQRAELDVLCGIGEENWKKIDQIVMEVHDGQGQQSEGRIGSIKEMLEQQGYVVVAEQDELLLGTDRWNLYAWRADRADRANGNGHKPNVSAGLLPLKDVRQQSLTAADLRGYLREKLPEYMVPSAFVLLPEMPLTRNGKIDRRALPSPEQLEAEEVTTTLRTPFEEMLSGVWAEVLNLESVSREQNFFELGGHSLLATQVMSRVREVFQVDLPLRTLFESPTLSELAERIDASLKAGHGLESPPINPVSRDNALPLSFAQQRLWFLDQLEPDSAAYNCPAAVRLTGALNLDVLEKTLSEVVRRHEILRTGFPAMDGQPVQVIAPAAPLKVELIDLGEMNADERETEAQRLAKEDAERPFDLAQGPLLRATLLRLSVDEHIALFTMHHIVSDAWSMGVLVLEIAALYEAYSNDRPSPLPELDIQYADYAKWQQDWLRGEVLDKQLAYWKRQLQDSPPVLELPTDRPRPVARNYQGATKSVVLPSALSESLKHLSREEGTTMFMTLLAAFQVLLARYAQKDDINTGTAIAGRNKGEIEGLIGFFINTLVMRTDLSGNPTFQELLGRVRETCLGAYAHQDLPFEKLVEELQPERSLSYTPLFQVMFILHNVPRETLQLPGLTLGSHEIESVTSKFDLTLSLAESEQGIAGTMTYNTDLFEAETIERMVIHFQTLLEGVAANRKERILSLPLLSQPERRQLLFDYNDTAKEFPPVCCIHELFEAQVERTPDAAAVVYEGRQLTFAELNARANQLARHLQSLGVETEVRVSLCVEHSLEMIVGLLGILKAGGAYVGLDPAFPKERLAFMLEDSQSPLLLTQSHLLQNLPPHAAQVLCLDADWPAIALQSEDKPESRVLPENIAHLLYTSGSTGKPKGVIGEHRQLVHYLNGILERLELVPGASFAMHQTLAVDALITILYPSLTTGGALHLITSERATDPIALGDYFEQHQIDYFKTAASHMAALTAAAQPERVMPRRLLVLGGEASRTEWIEQLQQLAPGCVIVNHYGPTETTCGVATYRAATGATAPLSATLPLSRPLANSFIYLLDSELNPVPMGVPGEMYIGGGGVARGYQQRPELSAERFIPDPYSDSAGARMYTTGDLAKFLPDGNIEFLGRKDHQVKVRGYRIELDEVQTVLGHHTGVRSAVVVAHDDGAGDNRLVAYFVPEQEPAPTATQLRGYLRDALPEYMIPSIVMQLEKLPLTPQGKVDRRALPAPDSLRRDLEKVYCAPRTPTEERLAAIWMEVLRVERVGVQDNFFELGGHSLLATQVVSRMRESFATELPLRRLFEHPTVAGVAEIIDEALKNGGEQTLRAPAIKTISRAAYRVKRSALDEE
jgi:amino acid adenylation domain-containing protein/FkbM family methyltransferase